MEIYDYKTINGKNVIVDDQAVYFLNVCRKQKGKAEKQKSRNCRRQLIGQNAKVCYKGGVPMFEKRDAEKEERMIQEIIARDEDLRKEHELFEAQMRFKHELIKARKAKRYTQNDVSRLSGLSQQAVSRLEKGKGATVETILKYLNSIGYILEIKEADKNNKSDSKVANE